MKRKLIDTLLFLIVAAGCVLLTLYLAGDKFNAPATVYNFVFLGVMAVLYLTSLFGGLFRMSDIASYFSAAASSIKEPGEGAEEGLEQRLETISYYRPLKKHLNRFLMDYRRSGSGICDIEDYINEEEMGNLVHKRLMDNVPDILTSIGILGTFVGLVLGLRSFEPSNYNAMTASVTSLVEGIKVAFLTSIYGLILSLINSFSLRMGYSEMIDELNHFLDVFHNRLVPSAEMEAQNRLVSNQMEQNELIRSLTHEFSDQVAHGFAANMAPTLERINTQLGSMMTTITSNQQLFLTDIVNSFLKEMKSAFHTEFNQFGDSMKLLNDMVNSNLRQSEETYRKMSSEMRTIFTDDEKAIRGAVTDFSEIQNEFGRSVSDMMDRYGTIMETVQKAQQDSLDNLTRSEKESARFWTACNQAMKNYLEAAGEAYSRFEAAHQASDKMLRAITATYQKNEKLLEESARQTAELQKVQQQMNDSLAEISRVFGQLEVAGGDGKNMFLYPGVSRYSREQEQRMYKQMGDIVAKSEKRQDAKLNEILDVVDELSEKADRKSKWFSR